MSDGLFDGPTEAKERNWVLLIDDDEGFSHGCIRKLDEEVQRIRNGEVRLKFEPIVSRSGFDLIFDRLMAQGRLGNIVYALVDLKLPSEKEAEESTVQQIENGSHVLERLRKESEIPIYLISSASRELVDTSVLQHAQVRFVEKMYLNDQVESIAWQLLNARDRPRSSARGLRVLTVKCPDDVRGKEWELPLAQESKWMSELLNTINRGIYQDAAAVLLLGGPGVEFEQISWQLYHSVTDPSRPYRFRVVNCRADLNLEKLKRAIGGRAEGGAGELSYWFVKNVQDLDQSGALALAGLLEQADHLGPERDRVTLAGVKDRVDDRILDRFALAGHPDFYIVEIPELEERRPDISAYLHYFTDARNRDSRRNRLQFDERALEVLESIPYPRNFKDLANRLDELFRRCQDDIITVREVQRILQPDQYVDTVWQRVIDQILTSERLEARRSRPSEPGESVEPELDELCTTLLVAREERGQDKYADDQLYQDLQLIKNAIEHGKRFRDDPSAGEDLAQLEEFWPLTRFPVCTGLVKVLQRHDYTIGVVKRRK